MVQALNWYIVVKNQNLTGKLYVCLFHEEYGTAMLFKPKNECHKKQ